MNRLTLILVLVAAFLCMVFGGVIWEAIDKDPGDIFTPDSTKVKADAETFTGSGNGFAVGEEDSSFVAPPNIVPKIIPTMPVVAKEDFTEGTDPVEQELSKKEVTGTGYWKYYHRPFDNDFYNYDLQVWFNTETAEVRDTLVFKLKDRYLLVAVDDLQIEIPTADKPPGKSDRSRKFFSNFSAYVKYGRTWKDDSKYIGAGCGPEFYDRLTLMAGIDDRAYELFFQTKFW